MIDFSKTRYNLEFLIGNKDIPAESLEGIIAELGEEIEIFTLDLGTKVHIHTDEPELVLSLCGKIGKLNQIKVEDLRMRL